MIAVFVCLTWFMCIGGVALILYYLWSRVTGVTLVFGGVKISKSCLLKPAKRLCHIITALEETDCNCQHTNITWSCPILAGRIWMTSFRMADHRRVWKPNEYSSVLQLPRLLQMSPYFVGLKIKKVVKYKFYWCERENPCFVPCRGLLGWNYFKVSHLSWKPGLLLGIWRPVCERWLHG